MLEEAAIAREQALLSNRRAAAAARCSPHSRIFEIRNHGGWHGINFNQAYQGEKKNTKNYFIDDNVFKKTKFCNIFLFQSSNQSQMSVPSFLDV